MGVVSFPKGRDKSPATHVLQQDAASSDRRVSRLSPPTASQTYAKSLKATAQLLEGDVRVVRDGDHALLRLGPFAKRLDQERLSMLIEHLQAIQADMEFQPPSHADQAPSTAKAT